MKEPEPREPSSALPHPSRLELFRFLSGDLGDQERIGLESHLRACQACSAAYSQAKETASGFAVAYPTRDSLAASRLPRRGGEFHPPGLRARLARLFTGRSSLKPVLGLCLFLLAVGALVRLGPFGPREDLSSKGGQAGAASFFIFLNGRPAQGDTLICRAGDTLQLGILAAVPVHYAVLYRDDAGAIEFYLGEGPEAQERLGLPAGERLPRSLILDRGWKQETLYCLWSPDPISREAALAAAGGKPVPGGRVRSHTFFLLAADP